jgi:hypothetical protein
VTYVSNETGVNEVFGAEFRLDSATGKAVVGNGVLVEVAFQETTIP